jgi:hypothetical protein
VRNPYPVPPLFVAYAWMKYDFPGVSPVTVAEKGVNGNMGELGTYILTSEFSREDQATPSSVIGLESFNTSPVAAIEVGPSTIAELVMTVGGTRAFTELSELFLQAEKHTDNRIALITQGFARSGFFMSIEFKRCDTWFFDTVTNSGQSISRDNRLAGAKDPKVGGGLEVNGRDRLDAPIGGGGFDARILIDPKAEDAGGGCRPHFCAPDFPACADGQHD